MKQRRHPELYRLTLLPTRKQIVKRKKLDHRVKERILEGTAGDKTFPLAPVSPVRFRIDGMPGKNYLEFLPQDDAVKQVRVKIQGITPVLMERKE